RYTLLAPWVLGVRDTPVTATRLLAKNAAAAWLMLCMASPLRLSVVVFGVDRQVQREDAGQDQHVVLAGGDVDRVARGHGEQAFGDGRDRLAVPLDRELVVHQVAADLHLAAAGDVDGEPVAEGGEQVLAHLGHVLAVDGDLVGGAERGQLALHLPDLAPGRILEDEPVMQAHHLAVHVQHRLPGLVGDVGILTQAEHALANYVHRSSPPALTLSSVPGTGWNTIARANRFDDDLGEVAWRVEWDGVSGAVDFPHARRRDGLRQRARDRAHKAAASGPIRAHDRGGDPRQALRAGIPAHGSPESAYPRPPVFLARAPPLSGEGLPAAATAADGRRD